MYRSFKMRETRNCPCNKENALENICDDVMTLSDYDLDKCDCGFDDDSIFPENPILGNSYVPNQILKTTFMPNVGLKLGTIFPELVRPYMPGQSMAQNEYLRMTNTIKEGCKSE